MRNWSPFGTWPPSPAISRRVREAPRPAPEPFGGKPNTNRGLRLEGDHPHRCHLVHDLVSVKHICDILEARRAKLVTQQLPIRRTPTSTSLRLHPGLEQALALAFAFVSSVFA